MRTLDLFHSIAMLEVFFQPTPYSKLLLSRNTEISDWYMNRVLSLDHNEIIAMIKFELENKR